MVFKRIKKVFTGSGDSDTDYLEIDLGKEEKQNKVLVKLFVLKTYEEVAEVLNALRDGYTIAIIDVRVLRQKDSIELKRAVSKIKKTVDALEGNIAGFTENANIIIATPSFAKISKDTLPVKQEKKKFDDFD